MYFIRVISSFFLMLVIVSCNDANDVDDYSALNESNYVSGSSSDFSGERNAYFGDLHVHTKHSFDAHIFGTTASPDDAYRYAKGDTIQHALGYDMKLRVPLDFYAVTDHGFLLGQVERWADPNNGIKGTEPFHNINLPENLTTDSIPQRGSLFQDYVRNVAVYSSFWTRLKAGIRGDQALGTTLYDLDAHRSAWQDVIRSAQEHNDPGKFTTFVAYEFTSSTTRSADIPDSASMTRCLITGAPAACALGGYPPHEGANLHRNVIFNGNKFTKEPFSRLKSLNPEDLWTWMDMLREKGVDTIAIPHNSNGSNGQMFEVEDWAGFPMGNQYAEFRMRNEPLVEMTQVKGTSETHPLLSPNDEWADFEIMDQRVGVSTYSRPFGSYVRQAYLDGLGMEEEGRGNPYKFGMVGASDTHTAAISDNEADFTSKVGILDGTPEGRGSVPLTPENADLLANVDLRQISVKKIGDRYYNDTVFKQWGASGLAVVWAEENTRDSIFSAFRRKETYATSGTRIKLRFFASEDIDESILNSKTMIKDAYSKGVPMGGDIIGTSDNSPNFLVWAIRDANGGALQRIQIVKGSVAKMPIGKPNEKVYDVSCSDGLNPDPITHRCPDNGAKVNLSDCSVSADRGSSELKVVWKDPDFNENEKAFYYVRVLENPSCRWSTWDAIKNGHKPRPDLQATIQERAWSSPIWYTPKEN